MKMTSLMLIEFREEMKRSVYNKVSFILCLGLFDRREFRNKTLILTDGIHFLSSLRLGISKFGIRRPCVSIIIINIAI